MNYNKEMENIIAKLDSVPRILIHSCCGPCSTSVIDRLKDYFHITVLYYNPNIEPKEEYEKRKEEQKKVLKMIKSKNNISFIDCDYDNEIYHQSIKGLEKEKEGGPRCKICYNLRMEYTRNKAIENDFDFFTTTLSVSPFKNANWINEIGLNLENEKIKFLPADFKKKDGYKKSILFSREFGLYRQNYCGCIYSKEESIKSRIID